MEILRAGNRRMAARVQRIDRSACRLAGAGFGSHASQGDTYLDP